MVTKKGRPAALLVNVQEYARLNEKQRGREAFLIARRHEMPIGSISPHGAKQRGRESFLIGRRDEIPTGSRFSAWSGSTRPPGSLALRTLADAPCSVYT